MKKNAGRHLDGQCFLLKTERCSFAINLTNYYQLLN